MSIEVIVGAPADGVGGFAEVVEAGVEGVRGVEEAEAEAEATGEG